MRAELDVSLRDADRSTSAREALESAQEEVERRRSIVENLLMLARADDGSLELLRAPVDLAGVTKAVTQNASVLARPKRVGIVTQGPRATVLADRARIEQVAMNLVNNAMTLAGRRTRDHHDVAAGRRRRLDGEQ